MSDTELSMLVVQYFFYILVLLGSTIGLLSLALKWWESRTARKARKNKRSFKNMKAVRREV